MLNMLVEQAPNVQTLCPRPQVQIHLWPFLTVALA